MALYVVSYDLRHVKTYEDLIARLQECGFVNPLNSLWLGSSPANALAVRNDFRTFMDNDDGLVVIEIKPGSDWAIDQPDNFAATAYWLKSNLGA